MHTWKINEWESRLRLGRSDSPEAVQHESDDVCGNRNCGVIPSFRIGIRVRKVRGFRYPDVCIWLKIRHKLLQIANVCVCVCTWRCIPCSRSSLDVLESENSANVASGDTRNLSFSQS